MEKSFPSVLILVLTRRGVDEKEGRELRKVSLPEKSCQNREGKKRSRVASNAAKAQ